MSGRCLAIANNDIVHIAWSFDAPLPGCSGFYVFRRAHGDTGPGTPLRSLVAFEDRGAPSATPHGGGALPHDAVLPHGPQALIKGFKWRDLLAPEHRGVTVRYRIVAMPGDEANATPLAGVAVLETAAVTPSPNYGAVDASFNRGILSTQSLVRTLAHYGGATQEIGRRADLTLPPRRPQHRSQQVHGLRRPGRRPPSGADRQPQLDGVRPLHPEQQCHRRGVA